MLRFVVLLLVVASTVAGSIVKLSPESFDAAVASPPVLVLFYDQKYPRQPTPLSTARPSRAAPLPLSASLPLYLFACLHVCVCLSACVYVTTVRPSQPTSRCI